jgi:hypothetical protein
MWTAFDYLYRDAGNFKAFGTVILKGRVQPSDRELIRSRLSSGEFFVAEQVGVPPLYGELYRWTGGPTELDHCWHEFVGFREIESSEGEDEAIASENFVSRFAGIEDWDGALSPHFTLP